MYESYLALGGVEIANVDRLVGYAKSVGCSVSWLKANGCGTLRYALGDELPYTHETIDQAPWYDQSQPDLSSRFLGIMVIDQKGLSDSSRQASLTEGIVDGGTIGGQRRASREARFRVLVVAEGSDALDYGIAWLSSALDADKCGQHGGRCGVTDLEFFTTCPEEVPEAYVGDTLMPDTPQHIIEGLREQSSDLEPIVNYAPEIEGSDTWETVYENLFTNPRLEGNGTWAEVRRNLNPQPKISLARNLWQFRATLEITPVSEGVSFLAPDGVAPNNFIAQLNTPAHQPLASGDSWLVTASLKNTGSSEISVSIGIAQRPPSGPPDTFVMSGNTVLLPGERKVISAVVTATSSGTVFPILRAGESGVPDGGQFVIEDGFFWEKTSVPSPSFDGNTTPETAVGIDQPEDFRWRWLGTPNESESVMEIERVAGLSGNYAIAGVSSRDGKPAVRLMPTNEGSFGTALLTVPIEARAGGTALGTLHLDEPLTGSLSTNALSISVFSPTQKESAPNTPGKYPLRLVFSELTSGNTLVLNHGGLKGSGDVWWTDIGLFAGDYPYGTFNGESDPAETGIEQPEDFRIRWTDEVDNSTSVLEIETVAGWSGVNAIAGVSTRDGKPAVRIIPTGTGPSAAFATIPVTEDTVTGVGTVSLDAPLQGTLYEHALTLSAEGGMATAPNLAGDHPLRAIGEVSSGYAYIVLINGATQGNGDVWWYDLGLFEDEYSGPTFSADTGWFQVDGNWYYATAGADGLTTAYPGHAIFTYPTDNIKRFMHDVATVSGPLLIEELPTASGRYKGAILEFTIASERGYIYTVPRELNLAAAELSAAADEDINLAKNPSFELALTSRVAAGYNLATNPSVETNTNNWSTSFGAASRSNLVSAYGSYSYMVELTGSSSILGPDATYTQTNMGVPGQPLAGKVRKLAVGMWGALSVSAGAAQPTQMRFTAIVNGDPIQLETVEDESQFGGYYFMHDLELPSDWDGNLSLLLTSQFSNSGTSTVRLFGDGVFIGLGGA